MAEIEVLVKSISDEAEGIRSFVLAPPAGTVLPAYAAGSHIDVHISQGLVRQYSLCAAGVEPSNYTIAVKREPRSRGGSRFMHEELAVGSTLKIGAPRNNFPLDEQADHSILLAGGIGITPIIAMADRLAALGRSFELHYFARSIAQTAFHDRLSKADYTRQVHFHYSLDPDGVRSYLRKLLWDRRTGGHLYLCGPKPFMDMAETVAAATWPPEAVHLEYFSADPISLAGPRAEFEVSLARTGGTFLVPEDKSIIEVLADNGIDIEYSCEQGVCGTCLTGVLDGEPDHRDMFMTAEEKSANDKMCPCVSRARSSRLTLDI